MSKVFRCVAALVFGGSIAGASWVTFGSDAQRSGWAKEESVLSPESAKQIQLLWKLKLDNEPKELNSLTAPVVINPVYTNHGAETYAAVGGSSDNLYVIDTDTGKLVWQKHFENNGPPPSGPQSSGSYFCPNALNDTPVIVNGHGGPSVYVISSDGKLHALNIINGEDRFAPAPFVPPYSKNWSLNAVGNVLYTTTSQGCGQAKSGVYALDTQSPEKKVSSFQSAPYGAGIWGRGGVSIGSDGTVFAATGDGPPNAATGRYSDAVVELQPKTLQMTDYYMPTNAAYITRKDLDMGNSTPLVFTYKGRQLLVIGGKEGVLTLLDAKSLGGEGHHTPLYQTPPLANDEADISGRGFWGAFATWEDGDGTRWIYAPAWGPVSAKASFPVTNGPTPDGCVMAFKLEEKSGQMLLTPAWVSRNMGVPEPPAIANGVVFALSSGEFTRQIKEDGTQYTTAERRAKNPGNATLYALDAKTGKELFSSGKTMPSFTHFGGIAVSDGRIYATTWDSTVYAFGVPGQ